MAILGQGTKRAREDEAPEDRPVKRADTEATEPVTGDEDEEGSQWSEGDLPPFMEPLDTVDGDIAWQKEDFTQHPRLPVEISDDELAKFNAAFTSAQAEWAEDSGRVLVMGSPVDVRPVPQTAEELKANLATFRLSDYGYAQKVAFEEELDEALMEEEEEEDEVETEDEAEGPELPPCGRKVVVMLKEYVEAAATAETPAEATQIAVVVTHGLLDAELEAFCEAAEVKAQLVDVLEALADVWRGLLPKSAAELGLSDGDRRGAEELLRLITTAVDDPTFIQGSLKGSFTPHEPKPAAEQPAAEQPAAA